MIKSNGKGRNILPVSLIEDGIITVSYC